MIYNNLERKKKILGQSISLCFVVISSIKHKQEVNKRKLFFILLITSLLIQYYLIFTI